MSKFITGKELEETVDSIIWDVKSQLVIVSPYIKLDDHFKKLFKKHLDNPKVHIKIIFGKNEGQVSKSFNKNDLEFFLQFQNISIVYVPHLHAKYYANESMGVLTSINLYDFSFKNNIEFGVLYENNVLTRITKNTDDDAWNTCCRIADENEVIYIKRPVFKKKLFGLGKDYISSKILCDRTADLYKGRKLEKGSKILSDYEDELDHSIEYAERPSRQEDKKADEKKGHQLHKSQDSIIKTSWKEPFEPGYCIRTGEKIPFDPERPLSLKAYQSWSFYGNPDFPEKFCHYSGEASKGETTMSRPILSKNWKKSQQLIKF